MTTKRKGHIIETRRHRKGERLVCSGLALAIACALPGVAMAVNYTASDTASLVAAIQAANGDGASSSTITLTGNITLTTLNGVLPSPTKSLTIDTAGFTLTGVGASAGIEILGTTGTLTFNGTLYGGDGTTTTSQTNGGIGLWFNSTVASSTTVSNATIIGGNGGSAGGIGGVGMEMNAGTFLNNGTITGGNGTGAGNAGGGGAVVQRAGVLTNDGSIMGGVSQGIAGPAGVTLSLGGGTLINNGTVQGGQSVGGTAAGGPGVYFHGSGTMSVQNAGTIEGGADAVGILQSTGAANIINSGTIEAGAGQADAIQNVTASTLTLQLQAGSTILGNVVAGSNANNTLILGGSTNATFDVSSIGPTAQYQQFSVFQKTGTSTWALTGAGTVSTPWDIQQGTLQVGNGGTSGSFIGNVTDDGTLAFDRSDVSTFSNLISGTGSVNQVGTGTTVLTATNAYTGGTTISAGTLQIGNGGTVGSIVGDVTDNGTLAFDHSDDVTVSGTISGSGGFTQLGTDTLTFTADNTYTGTTLISSGTLQLGNGGTTGSIVGNVTDNGALVFDRSDDVTFGGVVSGSGTLTTLGGDTLTLTGNNTFTGTTTISSGTLQLGNGGTSGALAGAVANSGTLVFDRSDAVSFGGAISGTGDVEQMGGGTTTLTGTSSYTGTTSITAGTLAVTGSIADSAVTVASGATLAGTGTVGATTVQTGGIIAPTGLATLSVNGNYVQQSGATYQVSLDPGSDASSKIAVSGTATLDSGAALQIVKTSTAPYLVGNKYTVLTATGGSTGTFDLGGQTTISALLALQGTYDANNAYLNVVQTGSVGSVATTPNQAATGGGIASTGPTSATSTAVLNSATDDAAREALDKLSGEVYASGQTALQEDSEFTRDAAIDRMRDAFCSVGANANMQGASTQSSANGACSGNPEQLVTWGQAFGSWGNNDNNGNAATLDHSTGGLFVGADTSIAANWRAGVLAGYGRSGFDVNARDASGSSDDYYLGFYGGTQWNALGFRTGATYTWHDLSSNRLLDLPGLPGSVGANYHAGTAQVFGDLGYRIDVGTASYEPFANLAYSQLHTNGFTETGGGAALISRSEDMDTTFSTLGLRASNAFIVDGTAAAVHASLGWRHAYGDVTPQSQVAFADGNDFDIAGVAIARNAGLIDLGLDVQFAKNATFGFAYFGEYGSRTEDQGVRGTLHLTF